MSVVPEEWERSPMPDCDTREPKRRRMSIGLVRRIVPLVVCACVIVVFAPDQGLADNKGKLPPYKAVYVDDEADCYDTYTNMSGTCFEVHTKATDLEDVARIVQKIYETDEQTEGYEGVFVQFYFVNPDCAIGCPSDAYYSGDEPLSMDHVKDLWESQGLSLPHGKVVHGVYIVYGESIVPVWLRGCFNWAYAHTLGYFN
jgi:hypothetical protein